MILNLLVEGLSMRLIARTVGVSINAVTKLLVEAGKAYADYHDATGQDVESERIRCDAIWSFRSAKAKNVKEPRPPPSAAGDMWTWTTFDPDSKLILAWKVGDRSARTATISCTIWRTVFN